MSTPDLRHPIGRFSGETTTPQNRSRILLDIADLPGRLRDAVEGLTDSQLDTAYRPEGWTVRQVVHHLADAHVNSYIRTRFALTVNEPTIMPFDEEKWAELKDARSGPVEPSLLLLEGVHSRWTQLLESLSDSELQRTLVHPENGVMTIAKLVSVYAWHGRHHTAHITELRKRNGW